jgi:hypothetical protein
MRKARIAPGLFHVSVSVGGRKLDDGSDRAVVSLFVYLDDVENFIFSVRANRLASLKENHAHFSLEDLRVEGWPIVRCTRFEKRHYRILHCSRSRGLLLGTNRPVATAQRGLDSLH